MGESKPQKVTPFAKAATLVALAFLCGAVGILAKKGIPFYKVWMDNGCLTKNGKSCFLHVGTPQVLQASAIQGFAKRYQQMLQDSDAYYQHWLTTPQAATKPCINDHIDCAFQASLGRCENGVKSVCALSCQTCGAVNSEPSSMAADPRWFLCVLHPLGCVAPQYTVEDATIIYQESYHEHVGAGATYLKYLQGAKELKASVRNVLPYCQNLHEECTLWALQGKCNGLDRFHKGVWDMQTDCPVSCQCCENLLYDFRCPLDPNALNALEPGDLYNFFWNLTAEPRYEGLQVWSSPTVGASGNLVADTAPWVITIDNFLTDNETDTLIELGEDTGYVRSDDWARYLPDGTIQTYYHDGRTSFQVWCRNRCEDTVTVQTISKKIEALTGIPSENSERLQLLRYREGQKYDLHHDWDSTDVPRRQGVRILTVFLYLSDVTDGGGTHFPYLNNLTFTPRKGRLVMWPNVQNMDPHEQDPRTQHAALPVGPEGIKYAANSWIHQRSIAEAAKWNCVG